MTTSVTVSVNGRYCATVTQDNNEPVKIEGGDGAPVTRTFNLPHPANSTFTVTEEPMGEQKERPARNNEYDGRGDR